MASSNPIIEAASTLQSASLNRNPSPTSDINPSTSTSSKTNATAQVIPSTSSSSPPPPPKTRNSRGRRRITKRRRSSTTTTTTTSSSPTSSSSSQIKIHHPRRPINLNTDTPPPPRHRATTQRPPLPDLRFEQSYLTSIRHATTPWAILYITTRDQVLMPLVQGVGWNLAVFGWRYWNRGGVAVGLRAAGSGGSGAGTVGGRARVLGEKVRRWWWRVNDWELEGDSALMPGTVGMSLVG